MFQEPQKRKKLSGAQFRHQKREKERQKEKLTGSIVKFLSNSDKECQEILGSVTSSTSGSEHMEVSQDKKTRCSPSLSDALNDNSDTSEGIPDESSSSTAAVCSSLTISDDPGLWPASINSDLVNILVKRGPVQVRNHNFSINDDGRKFADIYYYRNLSNGEKINRDWLLYSFSKDSVYCFCCKMFGKSVSRLSDLNGFSDWQHLSLTLKRHETSDSHNENVKSWVQLNNMLKTKTTVNQMQLRLLESEKSTGVMY